MQYKKRILSSNRGNNSKKGQNVRRKNCAQDRSKNIYLYNIMRLVSRKQIKLNESNLLIGIGDN